MARLVRPLMQWPKLRQQYCHRAPLNYFFSSFLRRTPIATEETTSLSFSATSAPSSHGNVHNRLRALKPRNAPPLNSHEDDSATDSDSDDKKSRNQKKREARRAVRWGMQIAAFSTTQIKRILSVASLDEDVFDAIMLVKRLGPDVKEGKRRQFNYIGKLLREVEPELMEGLIQATKVGDHATLQALAAANMQNIQDDNNQQSKESEVEEEKEEEEEEELQEYVNIATRWYDGLINKDISITNEVYSVQSVDFDRQELRKLVRGVLSVQERQTIADGNEGEQGQVDSKIVHAKKSLTRFLLTLAKGMSVNTI
ncbi:hypothetical protein WN944_008863 [Citrus x changshan-huyou]|uniref:Uncharacterized protein n=1 Tax=Citrus x changshan-huyou TaxID=2935761 RepID=A0AAP0MNQ0_9ROSI